MHHVDCGEEMPYTLRTGTAAVSRFAELDAEIEREHARRERDARVHWACYLAEDGVDREACPDRCPRKCEWKCTMKLKCNRAGMPAHALAPGSPSGYLIQVREYHPVREGQAIKIAIDKGHITGVGSKA